jgi:hypothetical protein
MLDALRQNIMVVPLRRQAGLRERWRKGKNQQGGLADKTFKGVSLVTYSSSKHHQIKFLYHPKITTPAGTLAFNT